MIANGCLRSYFLAVVDAIHWLEEITVKLTKDEEIQEINDRDGPCSPNKVLGGANVSTENMTTTM